MNIVIYARFSSHTQNEQSIEGQLKECKAYAAAHGMTIVGEYIDRAMTGTNDNRPDFQKMIRDSERHKFEAVLVYQLDRFARKREDSAIYKARLKRNGVRVISAMEPIAQDASGILVEGVLESMAEYYSAELSQKIHRGMDINAEKCLSIGSNPGLGFIVNKDKTFSIDPEGAAIVREIYERFAAGETKSEIVRDMQRRHVKTAIGNEFSMNSLTKILSNKRYIGYYLYKGTETPDGMPRILDDELFYRVQIQLEKTHAVHTKSHGDGEYLLTTKLFCGHCKEMMIGYGGTSKTGRQYHYYACKKAKKKQCDKKIVSKELIENRVIEACLAMLTPENCDFIAKKVMETVSSDRDILPIKNLKKAIKDADAAIENLWQSLERGETSDLISERIRQKQEEKERYLAELEKEERKITVLTEPQILAFLDYIRKLPDDDVNKRRAIINIFVNTIYLYDDRFTIIFNTGSRMLEVSDIPLDDIETALAGCSGAVHTGSLSSELAPPKALCLCKVLFYCLKPPKIPFQNFFIIFLFFKAHLRLWFYNKDTKARKD